MPSTLVVSITVVHFSIGLHLQWANMAWILYFLQVWQKDWDTADRGPGKHSVKTLSSSAIFQNTTLHFTRSTLAIISSFGEMALSHVFSASTTPCTAASNNLFAINWSALRCNLHLDRNTALQNSTQLKMMSSFIQTIKVLSLIEIMYGILLWILKI